MADACLQSGFSSASSSASLAVADMAGTIGKGLTGRQPRLHFHELHSCGRTSINAPIREDVKELEDEIKQVNKRIEAAEKVQANLVASQAALTTALENLPKALLLEGIRVGAVSTYPPVSTSSIPFNPENFADALRGTHEDEDR